MCFSRLCYTSSSSARLATDTGWVRVSDRNLLPGDPSRRFTELYPESLHTGALRYQERLYEWGLIDFFSSDIQGPMRRCQVTPPGTPDIWRKQSKGLTHTAHPNISESLWAKIIGLS